MCISVLHSVVVGVVSDVYYFPSTKRSYESVLVSRLIPTYTLIACWIAATSDHETLIWFIYALLLSM